MHADEAVDWVDPERWAATAPRERLGLLKQVQRNLERFEAELIRADCEAKGVPHDSPIRAHEEGTAYQMVLVPTGGNVAACIDLYEALIDGRPLEPLHVHERSDGRFDVQVGPRGKDRLLGSDRTDVLRVKGPLERLDPYAATPGIVGVLGAGNYASSFETIRALFMDGQAVVHKPHHLNAGTDRVWEQVLRPLVDVHALAFCDAAEGRALTRDQRLTKLYFTGGTDTAKAISAATDTELVAECGGNNPCIVVPGDRAWTRDELRHHAIQLATFAKLNGGSTCGRLQTLVTSRRWPQRRAFLDALDEALREQTPGVATYYPGTEATFATFRDAYPDAQPAQPRGDVPRSETLLIEDVGEHSFATRHEAFCQIVTEVALDVDAAADAFAPAATAFCNEQLLGTLAATILVDEDTRRAHGPAIDAAVTDLRYGAIGVNTMPPVIWVAPHLTWGGNEEGGELVSGHGNFGNLLGFQDVEKSIVTSDFMSPGHLLMTNRRSWRSLSRRAARYAMNPAWDHLAALAATALKARYRRADF